MLLGQGAGGIGLGGIGGGDVSTSALNTVTIGESAGKRSVGYRNVVVGYEAGEATTFANDCVLIGHQSGRLASTLTASTFVGAQAGSTATRSDESTLVGYAAGQFMTDAPNNVGVGAYVLREATCTNTTAVGVRALERALDANNNTGVGCEVMQNMRSGNDNTALGYQSMRSAFTIKESTAIGAYSGYCNARGQGLTIIGYKAGEFLEEGFYSIALGAFALRGAQYSCNAVAIGPFAGAGATNATGTVLLGHRVASSANNVNDSVFIGANGAHHSSGESNVAIGVSVAPYVSGNDNTIIGAGALANTVMQATSTVAIGANVAPTLQSSKQCVLIGPGADTCYASAEYAISIGTMNALTNDRGITIGGNIENQRIASVLLGNDLFSDADNSVIVGKDVTVDSVIFFKDPLLAPYVPSVNIDAEFKLGASDISYADILTTPDKSRSFLTNARAGYLMDPASAACNSSFVHPAIAVPLGSSFDLRQFAPDNAYLINQGFVSLPIPFILGDTPVPQPASNTPTLSNIWLDLQEKEWISPSLPKEYPRIQDGIPSSIVDPYRERHDDTIDLGETSFVTMNVVGLHCNILPIPYRTPKFVPPPTTISQFTNGSFAPLELHLRSTESDILIPFSALTNELGGIDPQNKVVITDVVDVPPLYGGFSNIHTSNVYYKRPIENIFAASDTFAVQPVRLLKESYSQLWHGLVSEASNIVKVVSSDARFFAVSNVLADVFASTTSPTILQGRRVALSELITYAPSKNNSTLGLAAAAAIFRLTSLPSGFVLRSSLNASSYPGSVFTPSDIVTMINENIDEYPESSRSTKHSEALDALENSSDAIDAHIYPLIPNAIDEVKNILDILYGISEVSTDGGWVSLQQYIVNARNLMQSIASTTSPAVALLNTLTSNNWTQAYANITSFLNIVNQTLVVPLDETISTNIELLEVALYTLQTHVVTNHLIDIVKYLEIDLRNAISLSATTALAPPTYDVIGAYISTLSILDSEKYATLENALVSTTEAQSDYATWWFKFNVMRRIFITFGDLANYSLQYTAAGTHVVNGATIALPATGSIGFRAPTDLVNQTDLITSSILIHVPNTFPVTSVDVLPSYALEVPIGIRTSIALPFASESLAMCNIIPPRHGPIEAFQYTTSHPFANDDTDLFVLHKSGTLRSQNTQISITRPQGLFTTLINNIYNAPSIATSALGIRSNIYEIVKPLSNVFIEDSNVTYQALMSYDSSIGISNVNIDTNLINIATETNLIPVEESDGSNVDINLQIITTHRRIFGIDVNPIEEGALPIAEFNDVYTEQQNTLTYVTFANDPFLQTYSNITTSNISIDILETRTTAFNKELNIIGQSTFSNEVSTYIDGGVALTPLYNYVSYAYDNEGTSEDTSNISYTPLQTTSEPPSTYEKTTFYTSLYNVQRFEPTVTLRPLFLSSNAHAFTDATQSNSYSTQQQNMFIHKDVGPVTEWSPSDAAIGNIFMKLDLATTFVQIQHIQYPTNVSDDSIMYTATVRSIGYTWLDGAIPPTVLPGVIRLQMDMTLWRVELNSFIVENSLPSSVLVYIMCADNGYISTGDGVVLTQASSSVVVSNLKTPANPTGTAYLWYHPNPLVPEIFSFPESSFRFFYTNISRRVLGIVHAVIQPIPNQHPKGQGVALGLLRNVRSRTLQIRSFLPDTDIKYLGFVTAESFNQLPANRVNAQWTLRDTETNVNVIQNAVISRSDINEGKLLIAALSSTNAAALNAIVPSTPVYLVYCLNDNETDQFFPIYPYLHDDFPSANVASSSSMRFTWFPQSTRTTGFTGQFAEDIASLMYSPSTLSPTPFNAIDLDYRLQASLQHGIFYKATALNVQHQTFTHADLLATSLTYIPFLPNEFSLESIRFRISIYGRLSPLYVMDFEPLWFPILHTPTVDSTKAYIDGRSLPNNGYDDLPMSQTFQGVFSSTSEANIPFANISVIPSLFDYQIKLATVNEVLFTANRTYPVLPRTFISPKFTETQPSPIIVFLDEADRYIFQDTSLETLFTTTFDPSKASDLILYVTQAPSHGVVINVDGSPMPRFSLSDVKSGTVFYQHIGDTLNQDTLTISIASGPFDVSGSHSITFQPRKMPLITSLHDKYVFIEKVADLEVFRPYVFETNIVASQSAYINVIASNYVIGESAIHRINDGPFLYSLHEDLGTMDAPYPDIYLTFAANGTSNELPYVNPLANIPEYENIFLKTAILYLNKHVAIQSFENIQQPTSNQGFVYTFNQQLEGFSNFNDRTVGFTIDVKPSQILQYGDAQGISQISHLQNFAFSFDGLKANEEPIFSILISESALVFSNSSAIYTLQMPPFPFDVWNNFYFITDDPNNDRNASLYINYDFTKSKSANQDRNLFNDINVPYIDLAELKYIKINFNLQDARHVLYGQSNYVKDLGDTNTYLQASYSLSNYTTSLNLQNFKVSISTNTFDNNSLISAYNPKTYNVVLGKSLSVRGINNVCIGSTFSTSGQNSIILGRNIGIILGSDAVNDIYESIIIGSDCFANAFVRDVIAIGRNNYNNLISLDPERVAEFLSRKPILIGNDIGNAQVDYNINIGNAFLKTESLGKQIYLGNDGEFVGVGYLSNVGLSNSLQVNGDISCDTMITRVLQVEGVLASSALNIVCTAGLHIQGNTPAVQEDPPSATIGLRVDKNIVAQAYLTASDHRVKTNVTVSSTSEDLNALLNIPVVRYNFIQGGARMHGFIAQDVEAHAPYAVQTTRNAIPSIMCHPIQLTCQDDGTLIEIENDWNVAVGASIRLIVNNTDITVRIDKIINAHTVKINRLITEKATCVFVFGEYVNDFKMLDSDKLLPLVFNAIKDLHMRNMNYEETLQRVITRLEYLEDMEDSRAKHYAESY
jgi:hypothetical protein